jgi:hypothetical protein
VSDLSQHFAAILTRERVLADLSQEELSFLCSMHRTAISELERGVRLHALTRSSSSRAALKSSRVSCSEALDGDRGGSRLAASRCLTNPAGRCLTPSSFSGALATPLSTTDKGSGYRRKRWGFAATCTGTTPVTSSAPSVCQCWK